MRVYVGLRTRLHWFRKKRVIVALPTVEMGIFFVGGGFGLNPTTCLEGHLWEFRRSNEKCLGNPSRIKLLTRPHCSVATGSKIKFKVQPVDLYRTFSTTLVCTMRPDTRNDNS